MNKKIGAILLAMLSLLLCGCAKVGDKAANVSVLYGVTAIIAAAMVVAYCCLLKKKDVWFILLFSSIFVVNTGYFSISVSKTLEEALLANRIAYLGSSLLPLAMLMIIINAFGVKRPRWLMPMLCVVSGIVFLIAASPGYLDIYYKEVELISLNGASALEKVYGPLHPVYLFYLLGYCAATVAVVIYGTVKRRLEKTAYAVLLSCAVYVNIGVWFLEQIVRIDFEMLSVSYILSELFLLGLCLMVQETQKEQEKSLAAGKNPVSHEGHASDEEKPCEKHLSEEERAFIKGVALLTHTERAVYGLYLEGKGTKEIMAALEIKENTLKYHNKNIYGKLGVSSRKQLLEIAEGLLEKELLP